MGRVIANIRRDHDQTFVKHADGGDYLTLDELNEMIGRLTQLANDMSQLNMSQSELTDMLYQQSIIPLFSAAVLRYPFEHPYLYWRSTSTNRHPKEPRFCGVYFVTHPDYPEQVKIGCSIDIYQRTKALYHEYGKKHVRVLGYIETDAPYEIEEFLHRKFASVRLSNEWFDYNTVIAWLIQEGGVE